MTTLFDRFVERYGRLPTEFDPDYLEMLRMSKYRIMEVPDVQPGKCANCGSSKRDGRSYIDIGLDIPWYGALFLCILCLEEVAREVGLFKSSEEKLDRAYDELKDKEALVQVGNELRLILKDGFEGVKQYFDNPSVRDVSSDLPSHPGSDVESYQEPSESAAGKGDKPALAAKPRITKSTSSSGSKDLLSLADLLKSDS